jgi:hypothetical protein
MGDGTEEPQNSARSEFKNKKTNLGRFLNLMRVFFSVHKNRICAIESA